ncbi:hypothetical protein L6164_027155 [Bauhinia variegata]|uniref:Uncharacterized protein n=1 Tax=Bauhinia variegata TaxID=167791 RepID=A0ACB9LS19_BAUVA|nr:hypothetical protein L6164_027155 [Bauhinia variegata]
MPEPSSVYSVFSQFSLAELKSPLFPSVFFAVDSRRQRMPQQFASLNFVAVKQNGLLLGCSDSPKKGKSCKGLHWDYSGFLRRCKDLDSEEDFYLEPEILEFMKNSENPEAFPTERELVAAGRMDLLAAIIKKGYWPCLGWNLDEEGLEEMSIESEENEILGSGADASSCNSSASLSQQAMSSDESIELNVEESGIEGTLNRLEKDRNSILGVGFENDEEEWQYGATADAADGEKSSGSLSGSDELRNSLKPETWKSWIVQKDGSPDTDFEVAEIAPIETGKEGASGVSGNDSLAVRKFTGEHTNREKELDPSDGKANHSAIKSRIEELDMELSFILRSLRTRADLVAIYAGQGSSSDDLRNIANTWEFLENVIMKSQDRLRSVRAKLAVVEGKMALAKIDAQKMEEETQKMIASPKMVEQKQKIIASKLRDTCIFWPITASEVLLVGSFDGWSNQRKMEESDPGVFSLSLKLYPGKYEIKFIVDGEWRTDPLRPIVRNNGHVNNLLIVE